MSYPHYKRSAEKKPEQYAFDNDTNPFLRSSSSSTSVPLLFQNSRLGNSQNSQFTLSDTGDRPFKRSRLDLEFSSKSGISPSTPSRSPFNFTPTVKGLQDSILSTASSKFPSLIPLNFDKELSDARTKISDLEHAKNDLDRKVSRLETEKQSLELQIKELNLKNEKLKSDIKFYQDREQEASTKSDRIEAESRQYIQTSVRETTRLQNEISKLTQTLQDLRSINQSKESESNRTINALQSELTRLNHHIKSLNEEIQQQNEISTSRQAILTQVQEQLLDTEQKLQEFNQLSSQLDDFKHLKKQSQEQSIYIQNLEKNNHDLKVELERLRELSPSIQILQQKVESSEYQLSLMGSLRRQAAELEAENAALKKEKVEWTSYLDQEKDKININSPYKLCKELASRRIEINMLEEKGSRLEEQIKNRDMIISENECKIIQLNSKYKSMENKLTSELEISKRTKNLLQKEVEMLTEALKSYDKEEQHLQTNYDVQKIERIQALENLLATYKEQISAQLHNDQQPEDQVGSSEINLRTVEVLRRNEELQAIIYDLRNENVNLQKETTSLQMQINVLEQKDLKVHSSELIKQNEILQETINELKNENLSLQKHTSSLDQQVFVLEKAVGRGEYNRETTRVLELKDNPSSRDYAIRQSTLDALKTENSQLLAKLKELQKTLENNHTTQVETIDGTDDTAIDVIPIQSFTNLENENKQLLEQIAEKEKRISRLKEVWKTKAQEYREAVYSLLGYRFDFLENGRVRLTSMYSEQDDQSFVFTSDENDCGTMQLVGGNSEFIKSLDHLIKFWVVERSSIPCFLSSLTVKLFENTTSGPVGRDMDMSICSTANQVE
ncbi:2966_t:CDS:10 [Gigaspora rosea]|nr:2966_t:CDS:10 [Gigaspora rosea]